MSLTPGLFLLILAVPIIDLILLIVSGRYLGALSTIVFVVFSSVLGFLLLQKVGTHGWSKIQQNLGHNTLPTQVMIERVIFMIAGILLLIPGYITDFAGLVLLIPMIRNRISKHYLDKMVVEHPRAHYSEPGKSAGSRTIEGEFKRED